MFLQMSIMHATRLCTYLHDTYSGFSTHCLLLVKVASYIVSLLWLQLQVKSLTGASEGTGVLPEASLINIALCIQISYDL